MLKKNFAMICVLLLSGAFLMACEDGDEEPGDGVTPTTGVECTQENQADECAGGFACDVPAGADLGVCFESCTSDANCIDGFECAEAAEVADGEEAAPRACVEETAETIEPTEPFSLVAVVSTTAAPEGSTPGPNIDAIEIVRDGTSVWASSVAGNDFVGDGEPSANSPQAALGENEILEQFEGNHVCTNESVSADSYSLGATNGYIIVGFGQGFELENGDVVRVWEVSNPPCTNFTQRSPGDTFEAFVGQASGLSSRFDAGWLSLGSTAAPGPRAFTVAIPDAE